MDLAVFPGHVIDGECILLSAHVLDENVIHPFSVHPDIFTLEFH